jgi:hypothetical protein
MRFRYVILKTNSSGNRDSTGFLSVGFWLNYLTIIGDAKIVLQV